MFTRNLLKNSLRQIYRNPIKGTPQNFPFSNGNLWTSEQNPLPESERASYEYYFDFKYAYGQGGKLTMRLNKTKYNLVMHTLWEDYAEVNVFKSKKTETNSDQANHEPAYLIEETGEGGRNALFSDETYSEKSLQNDQFKVYARVPEYYSYDLEVNGPITHENTTAVSSKVYGDVRAITPFCFKAKKLKTENCEISAESIDIDTYLESFRAQVTSVKDIFMKKCAISGYAIIHAGGNISINSLYTNPERRPQNLFCNQSPSNLIQLRDSIIQLIESGPHIKIESKKGNIRIGVSHGTGKITTEQGDISISTLSNQQVFVQTLQGNVKTHIYSIVKDSYIQGDTLQITVEQSFKSNIYLIDAQTYFGEQKPDQPTIFLKGKISLEDIQIIKPLQARMPSFMMEQL